MEDSSSIEKLFEKKGETATEDNFSCNYYADNAGNICIDQMRSHGTVKFNRNYKS